MTSYRLYKTPDFLVTTESGEVDLEQSRRMVRKLVELAEDHLAKNILVDLRETTGGLDTSEIVYLALEFAKYRSSFSRMIAVLMPSDPERLSKAQKVRDSMNTSGFIFECFTEFEAAVNWLSVVVDLPEDE